MCTQLVVLCTSSKSFVFFFFPFVLLCKRKLPSCNKISFAAAQHNRMMKDLTLQMLRHTKPVAWANFCKYYQRLNVSECVRFLRNLINTEFTSKREKDGMTHSKTVWRCGVISRVCFVWKISYIVCVCVNINLMSFRVKLETKQCVVDTVIIVRGFVWLDIFGRLWK